MNKNSNLARRGAALVGALGLMTCMSALAQERCKTEEFLSKSGLSNAGSVVSYAGYTNHCKRMSDAATPMLQARAALENEWIYNVPGGPHYAKDPAIKAQYAPWVQRMLDDAFRYFSVVNDFQTANPNHPFKNRPQEEIRPGETTDPRTCEKCGDHLYDLQVMEVRINTMRNRLKCAYTIPKAVTGPISALDNLWRTRSGTYQYTDAERKLIQDYVSKFNVNGITAGVMGEYGKENRTYDDAQCAALANWHNTNTAAVMRALETSQATVKLPANHRMVVIQTDMQPGRTFCLSSSGGSRGVQECHGGDQQVFILDPEGRIKDNGGF